MVCFCHSLFRHEFYLNCFKCHTASHRTRWGGFHFEKYSVWKHWELISNALSMCYTSMASHIVRCVFVTVTSGKPLPVCGICHISLITLCVCVCLSALSGGSRQHWGNPRLNKHSCLLSLYLHCKHIKTEDQHQWSREELHLCCVSVCVTWAFQKQKKILKGHRSFST